MSVNEGFGLTITRDIGQQVVLRHNGVEVVVTYVKRAGNQVKLAFKGPREVTIYRAEVQQRIDEGDPIRRRDDGKYEERY